MKKIFLLIGLMAAAGVGHAQSIAAGTVALGGSIGYSHSTNNTHDTFSSSPAVYQVYASRVAGSQFAFMPTASYFVADNLAVGLNLSINNGYRDEQVDYASTAIASRTSHGTNRAWSIGAYVQYYKMLTAQFGLTGRLGGGYLKQTDRQTSNEYGVGIASYQYDNSGSGYYGDLTPGIIFLPVPKFGISLSMGALSFNHSNTESVNTANSGGTTSSVGYEGTTNYFGARFGFDYLLLGTTYYFGR